MTTHNKYTESRKVMERYEEKRKYPRIIVECSGRLLFTEKKDAEVVIYDICPGGIQVRCDRDTAQLLKHEKDKAAYDFGLTFVLPLTGKKVEIVVRCRLVYIVSMDNGIFASGMQFTSMDNQSRKLLKRFIESSMEPL